VYLKDKNIARKIEADKYGTWTLEVGTPYVFKIKEKLGKELMNSNIYGQATARSSVGRVDVLARLIVNGMDEYEGFEPTKNILGDMFIEVISGTFNIRVKIGKSLSQLRLFVGKPEISEVSGKDYYKCIFKNDPDKEATLSVDLVETFVGKKQAAAFCTIDKMNPPIDLWVRKNKRKPDPTGYWQLCNSKDGRLTIKENAFHLLRSKQLLALPGSIAVYARATDEALGEMRIHYAGFVHPWFGRDRDDGKIGTPLMFEVRGHTTNVNLKDDEKLARLVLYRMSEDAPKPSQNREKKSNPYENQTLTLSSFFEKWPHMKK
jgi:dCTP deaminase